MTTVTKKKSCRDCGAETQHEIPPGPLAGLMETFSVLCDPCLKKEEDAIEEEERERDRQLRARQLMKNLSGSGIPTGLKGVRLDSLEVDDTNEAAIKAARLWAGGSLQGLVMAGPVGVGKTYLAAAAANEMLRHRPVRWFSAARFMVQARAGFTSEARDQITEVLTKPHLALVLDDIDKANPTDFTREVLFEAIDERLQNKAPLLVTTNQSYHELEESLGEPIASRLSLCQGHRLDGVDRRRKKR